MTKFSMSFPPREAFRVGGDDRSTGTLRRTSSSRTTSRPWPRYETFYSPSLLFRQNKLERFSMATFFVASLTVAIQAWACTIKHFTAVI